MAKKKRKGSDKKHKGVFKRAPHQAANLPLCRIAEHRPQEPVRRVGQAVAGADRGGPELVHKHHPELALAHLADVWHGNRLPAPATWRPGGIAVGNDRVESKAELVADTLDPQPTAGGVPSSWSQERGQPVRGLVWCPVVAPRRPPQAPRSSQAATQAAASEPGPSTPQPAKRSKRTKAEPGAAEPTQPTKGKAQGKAAKAKPAPQPGRWLDRDCNAALNMQRIGESRWRPLELCFWPDQGALPAKGKEYPGLGYKRLRDKPPKAQEQHQQPAVAQ
ncbi:hypothetical protein QJQ45_004208 [Haematococcus lacustris]|nr:hypothetical protein QJQ45_004208 [Haematococcus lacustris]